MATNGSLPTIRVQVGDLATMLGGTVRGDRSFEVTGISGLAEADRGDISFLADDKYAPLLVESRASVVLVKRCYPDSDAIQIVVDDPNLAFAKVVEAYGPQPRPIAVGVHSTAVIGEDVTIAAGVSIGPYAVVEDGVRVGTGSRILPHAYVGADVHIGADCTIYPHATVREGCRLGDRVIIHSGVVIGSDGFGYASLEGVHVKIPQVGIVLIGDDVEIGANTTIDRARFGTTVIGNGTKIDNLVQIAHNVRTGEHCIIVAQVGIAGSSSLGNHVTIAGQSGVAGHLHISDQAVVAAQSGVSKNVPPRTVVQGSPAQELRLNQAKQVGLRRLPKTQATVKQLEQRITELERRLAERDGS